MYWTIDPTRTLLGYLVRHGELKNMAIWDGWGDYDLSAEGCQQAQKAAQWLSFERIGRIISSDVPRTVHTAQYLMDTGAAECPFLLTEPNLRPWNVSDEFTGKEKTPERIESFKKYIDNPDLVIPGGESRNDLDARVKVLWQYFLAPYNGKITVAFIHNSVLKALMGIDDIKDAVSPGGVVAVYMNEKGDIEYEIKLGDMNLEKGVS